MKIIVSLLMILVMTSSVYSFAEDIKLESMTREELIARVVELEAKLAAYEETESAEGDDSAAGSVFEERDSAEILRTLKQGDSGDGVKRLQQRLKALEYLNGEVDGIYGKGTTAAVRSFQKECNLQATGAADNQTQQKLYSEDAPFARNYHELDYNAVSRMPDSFTGRYVTFDGTVLQVMEDKEEVHLRMSTRDDYEDVVYVVLSLPDHYSRLLEKDKVSVKGTYAGLYKYNTVMGNTVTLPKIEAESIVLR